MKAYQNGNEEAFSVLYRRHAPQVYGFFVKRLRDKTAANDVFQATFLKVHQSRRTYNGELPFAPWLFTICRNTLIDHIRKGKRAAETVDEFNSNQLEQIPAPELANSPSVPSLETLTDDQRQALQMRYVSDLPFEEIAKQLRTTPSNVRQITSRAIRKLRNLMEPGKERE